MMKVSKPICGARSSATMWAAAASSTVSRRNRNSLALVLAPDWMISCAMSSSSGKKRAVRRMTIGRPRGVVHHAAEMLGRELADAVDVARLERRHLLVDPEGALDAALVRLADLLRDHQRGGRGEDEAVDRRARRRRLLQQVQRALHVGGDELRGCRGSRRAACAARRAWTMPWMRRSRIALRTSVAVGDRADDVGGRPGTGSRPITVWPARFSRGTRVCPSQPDEPVTRMFITGPLVPGLPAGGPPARRRRSRRSGSRTGGAS